MNATDLIDAVGADRAVKAKHRAMWALGDYPAVATEIIPDLGPIMVEACGVPPGDGVLDVAAGSGKRCHSCGASRRERRGPRA